MEVNTKINGISPPETSFKITKELLELAFNRKCYPSSSPGPREFLDGGFTKELFMYQQFLPKLKKLAAESGAENVVDLSVVPVHAGSVAGQPSKFTNTPWSSESFMLMTDLNKTSGFTMADRIQGLDLDQTKIAMEEIAKLHALSWAYKQKNGLNLLITKYPQLLSEMDTNSDPDLIGMGPLMTHLSASCYKMVEEKLGASHPACKSFKHFIARCGMETMSAFLHKNQIDEKSMESLLRIQPDEDKDYNYEPWLVGSHGDCWLNNLLFRYNDQGKPVAVTLVDYQFAREACPTVDLAYFLYASIRPVIRIQKLDELLQVYHDAFVRYCEALQVNLLPGFSLETLKRRFHRAHIFGLVLSIIFLIVVLKPKQNGAKVTNGHKVELKHGETLFRSLMEGMDQNELLKDEISSIVLHLYEIGVI
ncbi:hypothetical protein Ocin01_18035 [Orchesella cincta]|uniref:CHK kinase-like domain-containing protein n=1 Tax=Orchesella cincta TaxID=48709 RepID=A0A1D2M6P5_ORCCI|nr:hypothetical protein Ocin01_18035 [Orchesella cincta]